MKKSIKNILVPLDGSKNSFRGLEEAILLAKSTNASITGLFVIPTVRTDLGIIRTKIGDALVKHSKNFLAKAKRKCLDKSINFIDIIEYGDEGAKIVEFAKKYNFDLIIIGSRGIGGVRQLLLGSTTNHVLHYSTIPVLVVK